ncbi:Kelch repeat-containing protein [Butyricimonas paravirosa]
MRTFNIVVLAILGLFLASCGDDDDRLGDWAKSVQFSGEPREGSVCFKFKDGNTETVFVGLGFGARSEEFSDLYEFNGESWAKVTGTEFPAPVNEGSDPTKQNGNGRHSAVAFVIGDYAYVGTGYVSALSNSTTSRNRKFFNDFYKFNMRTKKWEGEAIVMNVNGTPVEGRRDAVAFSDGEYGYVGTGYGENDRVFKDFYRFDPNTETWEEISFNGDARYGAVAFVVNNAAYVALGASGLSSSMSSTVVRNVMKFDFATKTWHEMGALADKPGVRQDKDYERIPRVYAVSFTSDKGKDGEEYAYIALGAGANPRTVWKYNHKKDQWHQMEDISRLANSTYMAVGFSIGGYGYYTTGGSSTDGGTNLGLYIDTWRFIPDVKETRRNDY